MNSKTYKFVHQKHLCFPRKEMRMLLLGVLGSLLLCACPQGADVAVIGGGIAGAASAHFLRQLRPNDRITLFEKTAAISGRIHEDTIGGFMVETGAAAIHSSNRYMLQFAQDAGLTTNWTSTADFSQVCSSKGGAGIWDGSQFRLRLTGQDSSWFAFLKMAWRYGFSPLVAKTTVENTINSWEAIYDVLAVDGSDGFVTLEAMFEALKLNELLHKDSLSYLESKWIGQGFIQEFVDGVSRVNYGQDSSINAFADLVSLAGAGLTGTTYSVKEGNAKVVEYLAQHAHLLLNATVESIEVLPRVGCENKKRIHYTHNQHEKSKDFDAVILAAPYGSAGIKIYQGTGIVIEPTPADYKRTFVTYLEGKLNVQAFGLSQCSDLPDTITTVQSTTSFFRSVSVKGASLTNPTLAIYKIFSDAETTDEQLSSIFSEVGEVKRYVYDAYPILTPLSSDQGATSFVIGPGIFYANVMELTASCMEVESVAAKNVALLANNFLSRTLEHCPTN
eukprot:TRINITY_DN454_c0_g1_i1.p1 TRINITY_DN454_c0_g1~~TRINITY_DN454_c0_g1_i1.p1  ORF type:complete len:504 (-),score=119.09 TRINITY_DN454_c0_g1_i1:83-1594(-)